MPTYSLTEDELARARRMAAAAVDFLSAEASIRDGNLDENAQGQLRDKQTQSFALIDSAFALDLADRLGEEGLREALEQNMPPSARERIEALIDEDGGALPFVRNRIGRITAGPDVTFEGTEFGCALGAIAIVGGYLGNQIIGGIAVVVGIVAVAAYC
jgi:hypothetical protein